MYAMPAEQAAEALLASMKLNGIERLWFTSGTELAFFQEVPVKHQALGRPTPKIMTMTHENAALSAAMGETMISGKPSATAAHVECGMINAGGSIHNADRGHYPALTMSGYPPSAASVSGPSALAPGGQMAAPRRATDHLRLPRRSRSFGSTGANSACRDPGRAGDGRRLSGQHPGRPSAQPPGRCVVGPAARRRLPAHPGH